MYLTGTFRNSSQTFFVCSDTPEFSDTTTSEIQSRLVWISTELSAERSNAGRLNDGMSTEIFIFYGCSA
jgi:hypothetical protein